MASITSPALLGHYQVKTRGTWTQVLQYCNNETVNKTSVWLRRWQHTQCGDPRQRDDPRGTHKLSSSYSEQSGILNYELLKMNFFKIVKLWIAYFWNFQFNIFGPWLTTRNRNLRSKTRNEGRLLYFKSVPSRCSDSLYQSPSWNYLAS